MTRERAIVKENLLSAPELFQNVRDIPYVLGADDKPEDVFSDNFGGCTRKHLYLAPRLKQLGYRVEIGIARFDWRELPIPKDILALLKQPIQYHMFLYVNQKGNRFIADAIWDKEMCQRGFPLMEWDDQNFSLLGVKPISLTTYNLPVLRFRSLVSETINRFKSLANGPMETPFNDAFNSWLGRTIKK